MDNLTEQFNHAINQGLPGVEAHLAMAPMSRIVNQDFEEIKKTAKLSAVLVVLFQQNGEWHTLLMERNTYNGHHSGQISFPGGRKETIDSTLKETAIREFAEEMGVQLDSKFIISELTQLYIPPSNFYVQPYLAVTTEKLNVIPEEKEVKKVLSMPLDVLLDDALVANDKVKVSGSGLMISAPLYRFEGYKIWGATAMILSELKFLLKRINQ